MSSVTVDDDFARFGAKSYAINKINSVEVRKRHPHGQGLPAALTLIAILLFAAGQTGGAVFLGVIAAVLWWRSRDVEYLLFLMTSSSETQAFVTRDAEEVQSLRERIETAMIRLSQAGRE